MQNIFWIRNSRDENTLIINYFMFRNNKFVATVRHIGSARQMIAFLKKSHRGLNLLT